MARGLSLEQQMQMRSLSDQGLTGEQSQQQMQIPKTEMEINEIVKSVKKTVEATMVGREGRSDLSSWNKNHKQNALWGKDKAQRQVPRKASRRFKPARQMKHTDLPKHNQKRAKRGKYRGVREGKGAFTLKRKNEPEKGPKTRLGVSRDAAPAQRPNPEHGEL